MKIEFIKNDNSLYVRESTIRRISRNCEDCEKEFPTDHFQALVDDRRKKKNDTISCRIIYEDKDGVFLGLDEEAIYGVGKSHEIVISMPVTIPENAVKAKIDLEEISYSSIGNYTDYLIGIGVIVLVVFAVKGMFNW